jgi:hypothetical protein
MPDDKPRRVALGFHAGGALNLRISQAGLDALEGRLREGASGFETVETEDGPVLVNLAQVIYLRPESTESRIGF